MVFWDGTAFVRQLYTKMLLRHWLSGRYGVGCRIRKTETIDGLWLWRYTFSMYINKILFTFYILRPHLYSAFFVLFLCVHVTFFSTLRFIKLYNCYAYSVFNLRLSCQENSILLLPHTLSSSFLFFTILLFSNFNAEKVKAIWWREELKKNTSTHTYTQILCYRFVTKIRFMYIYTNKYNVLIFIVCCLLFTDSLRIQ